MTTRRKTGAVATTENPVMSLPRFQTRGFSVQRGGAGGDRDREERLGCICICIFKTHRGRKTGFRSFSFHRITVHLSISAFSNIASSVFKHFERASDYEQRTTANRAIRHGK